MKKKEKRLILILIAILVVVLIIGLFIKKNRNEENGVQSQQNTATDEKFVQVLEDGTKLNKSSKLNETKNVEGIEISNIQFTYKDGQTVLLADVTNNSGKAIDMTLLNIKLNNNNRRNNFTYASWRNNTIKCRNDYGLCKCI